MADSATGPAEASGRTRHRASAVSDLPVPYPVRYFFGYDPNYFGGTTWHGGVDIPCPVGTPIRATMGGIVSYAGWSDAGYGNLVVIENSGYQTYYAHASTLAVSTGDVVEAGQVVALSGNTGSSSGPHLHYEARVNGVPVNPLKVVLPVQTQSHRYRNAVCSMDTGSLKPVDAGVWRHSGCMH